VGLFGATFALIRPIKQIAQVNHVLQKGIAGAVSIFALLDEPQEKNQGSQTIQHVIGKVEFDDVSFAYNNSDKAALTHVSFTANPGETVAFVGRSGAGKTTLCALLPRFYQIAQGGILLDDINTEALDLMFLRKQIAIVSQHVLLFNDTIKNNLTYGLDPMPSDDKIIEAATAAYAMEFITQMPNGLMTVVGENGALLSGGQRQRLAIARAILKNAPILILDEATSALDSESENYIQKALAHVMQGRTTLVIAHRLSTIENANHIVVLEKGKVVEQGSHAALLAKNKAYAKLHQAQFQDKEVLEGA